MADTQELMNEKLEYWKNKLLDMTMSNSLLNFRDTKRGTLRFIKPNIYELWDSFVIKEKPLEFPLINEDEESFSSENTNTTLSILPNQSDNLKNADSNQTSKESIIDNVVNEDIKSENIKTNKTPKINKQH